MKKYPTQITVSDSHVIFFNDRDKLEPIHLTEDLPQLAYWKNWLAQKPIRFDMLQSVIESIAQTENVKELPDCFTSTGTYNDSRSLFRLLRILTPLIFDWESSFKERGNTKPVRIAVEYRLALYQVSYSGATDDVFDLMSWCRDNLKELLEVRGDAIEADLTENIWGKEFQSRAGLAVARSDGDWPAMFIDWLIDRGRPFQAILPWRKIRSLYKTRASIQAQANSQYRSGDEWAAKGLEEDANRILGFSIHQYPGLFRLTLRGLLFGILPLVFFTLGNIDISFFSVISVGTLYNWIAIAQYLVAGLLLSFAASSLRQQLYIRLLVLVSSVGFLVSFAEFFQYFGQKLWLASSLIGAVLVLWLALHYRPHRSLESCCIWAQYERFVSAVSTGAAATLLPALIFAVVLPTMGSRSIDQTGAEFTLIWFSLQAALHGVLTTAAPLTVPIPRVWQRKSASGAQDGQDLYLLKH